MDFKKFTYPAFFVGSAGTCLGALAAVGLIGRPIAAVYGDDGYKVCAALAAKNIGGGLNFVERNGGALGREAEQRAQVPLRARL